MTVATPPTGRSERLAYIAERLAAGATQKEIAGELGVTKQRVQQIASDMPLPCRCGCGGFIPPMTPGKRVYIAGHGPRFCECGKSKCAGADRCAECARARKSAEADDLTDKEFGSWTVIGRAYPDAPPGSNDRRLWLCRCACGVEKAVWYGNLKHGLSIGCRNCGYARRRERRRKRSDR